MSYLHQEVNATEKGVKWCDKRVDQSEGSRQSKSSTQTSTNLFSSVSYPETNNVSQKLKVDSWRKLCVHGRTKYYCTLCPGNGICIHTKRRYTCKVCKGQGICQHGKVRACCIKCIGSSICQHSTQRAKCKLCRGGAICEHSRRRYNCPECSGGGVCEHKNQRYYCKQCRGTGICSHGRQKRYCHICGTKQYHDLDPSVLEALLRDSLKRYVPGLQSLSFSPLESDTAAAEHTSGDDDNIFFQNKVVASTHSGSRQSRTNNNSNEARIENNPDASRKFSLTDLARRRLGDLKMAGNNGRKNYMFSIDISRSTIDDVSDDDLYNVSSNIKGMNISVTRAPSQLTTSFLVPKARSTKDHVLSSKNAHQSDDDAVHMKAMLRTDPDSMRNQQLSRTENINMFCSFSGGYPRNRECNFLVHVQRMTCLPSKFYFDRSFNNPTTLLHQHRSARHPVVSSLLGVVFILLLLVAPAFFGMQSKKWKQASGVWK